MPRSRRFPELAAGGVFWAESEGAGQEEQGEHPWVILSSESFIDETEVVVAVPMTSNVTRYRSAECYIESLGLVPRGGVNHRLDPAKMDGIVKCQQLRHWSVARITEIVGDIAPFGLEKLRGVVADVLDIKRRR